MKRTTATLALAVLAYAHSTAHAVPVPLYTGPFGGGDGLRGEFVELRDDWRGSRVPWNESVSNAQTKLGIIPDPAYGDTSARTVISNFDWGTGLWGLADADAALALAPNSPDVVARWSGRVRRINYGDSFYHQQGSEGKLGASYDPSADGLPFSSQVPKATQDNWAVRFTGYLAVTQAGRYNFRLTHDDGARLVLTGSNGEQRSILRDYLYPGVATFDKALDLMPGLYGLQVQSFDHLFLGYVNLAWSRDGGRFNLIDPRNFFTEIPRTPIASAVPEPGSIPLLGLALAALALARRRRH